MKNSFNNKFGPPSNNKIDQQVFARIAKERNKKNIFLRMGWLASSALILIAIINISNKPSPNDAREAYIKSVLEIQESLDDNLTLDKLEPNDSLSE